MPDSLNGAYRAAEEAMLVPALDGEMEAAVDAALSYLADHPPEEAVEALEKACFLIVDRLDARNEFRAALRAALRALTEGAGRG